MFRLDSMLVWDLECDIVGLRCDHVMTKPALPRRPSRMISTTLCGGGPGLDPHWRRRITRRSCPTGEEILSIICVSYKKLLTYLIEGRVPVFQTWTTSACVVSFPLHIKLHVSCTNV